MPVDKKHFLLLQLDNQAKQQICPDWHQSTTFQGGALCLERSIDDARFPGTLLHAGCILNPDILACLLCDPPWLSFLAFGLLEGRVGLWTKHVSGFFTIKINCHTPL